MAALLQDCRGDPLAGPALAYVCYKSTCMTAPAAGSGLCKDVLCLLTFQDAGPQITACAACTASLQALTSAGTCSSLFTSPQTWMGSQRMHRGSEALTCKPLVEHSHNGSNLLGKVGGVGHLTVFGSPALALGDDGVVVVQLL